MMDERSGCCFAKRLFYALFVVAMTASAAFAGEKAYSGDINKLFSEFKSPEIKEIQVPPDILYGRLNLRYFEVFEWGRLYEIDPDDADMLLTTWFVTPSGKRFRPEDLVDIFHEVNFSPASGKEAIEAAMILLKNEKKEAYGGMTILDEKNIEKFKPVFDRRRFHEKYREIEEKLNSINGDDIRKALIDKGYIDEKGVVQPKFDTVGDELALNVLMTPEVQDAVLRVVRKYRKAPDAEAFRLELNQAVWDVVRQAAIERLPREREILIALVTQGYMKDNGVLKKKYYDEKASLPAALKLTTDEQEALADALTTRYGTIPLPVLDAVHTVKAEKKESFYAVSLFAYVIEGGEQGRERVTKITVSVGGDTYAVKEKEIWSASGRQ